MAKQKLAVSIAGKDFNAKMVGKTLFKPNHKTSTIEKLIVRGMYQDGNKIVVALALDGNVQHNSYGMNESSGLYINEKEAEKILLDQKILEATSAVNSVRRYVLAREKQIELLQEKLKLEKTNLDSLEKNLEALLKKVKN